MALAGLLAGAVLVAREAESAGVAVTAAPRADDPECARIAYGHPSRPGGPERGGPGVAGSAARGDGAVALRHDPRPPAPRSTRT